MSRKWSFWAPSYLEPPFSLYLSSRSGHCDYWMVTVLLSVDMPFLGSPNFVTIISVDKVQSSARSLEKGWAWGPGWACGPQPTSTESCFFNNSCYLVCSYIEKPKEVVLPLCGFPWVLQPERANLRKSERTGYTRFLLFVKPNTGNNAMSVSRMWREVHSPVIRSAAW